VNGTPVTGRVRLKDGDEVKIGHQMIRVAAVKQEIKVSAAAKNTMGLVACPHCRHWMSMDDHICPSCGRSRDLTSRTAPPRIDVADSAEDPENDTRLPNVHSGQMISGLARKALSLNRSDEALKLTASLIESAIKKESTGESKEEDLEAIVELLVEIGIATQAPERISDIFSFFNTIRRLIPRKSVDLLYNSVRRTGYRSCPEMHRYLTTLGELSRKFSPGEKFIHRRIEGLVGLCS